MKVQLKPLVHRGRECIGIYFPKDGQLQWGLQEQAGVQWSRSKGCWYVPLSRSHYDKVCAVLAGRVVLDDGPLRKYLAERKGGMVSGKLLSGVYAKERIGKVNAGVLPALRQQLVLKAYRPSTIKTYMNEVAAFLGTLKEVDAGTFTVERIRDYLQYCFETLKLSEHTLHSRINALKFYYEQVLGRERFFWDIPRPKKPLQLPKVLNEEELRRLFNALPNRKHKAILFTAYSAGLRVSEVVNLKLADIDSVRMLIHVRGAKGKKDRVVNLSVVLLDILREYLRTYRPAPRVYLFESEQTGGSVSGADGAADLQQCEAGGGDRQGGGDPQFAAQFCDPFTGEGDGYPLYKRVAGSFRHPDDGAVPACEQEEPGEYYQSAGRFMEAAGY